MVEHSLNMPHTVSRPLAESIRRSGVSLEHLLRLAQLIVQRLPPGRALNRQRELGPDMTEQLVNVLRPNFRIPRSLSPHPHDVKPVEVALDLSNSVQNVTGIWGRQVSCGIRSLLALLLVATPRLLGEPSLVRAPCTPQTGPLHFVVTALYDTGRSRWRQDLTLSE